MWIIIDEEAVDQSSMVTICGSEGEVLSILSLIAEEHEVTDDTISIYVLGDHVSVSQFL